MKSIISILIVLILLGASCTKEDFPRLQINDEGEIVSLPYFWKKLLHKSSPEYFGFLKYPIFFNQNPIIPMTDGGYGRLLSMINRENGETIWEWDDRFIQETEEILMGRYHQYENLMVYTMGSRVYGINLESGQTQWKNRNNLNRSFWSHVYGKDSDFYMFGRSDFFPDSVDQMVVFKGDINTGQYEEYLIPNFTMDYFFPGNRIGNVIAVSPVSLDGKDLLAVVWQEPFFEFNWQSYLGLWHIENEVWVYEKAIINPEKSFNGILLNPPVVYQDKIYLAVGFELACHDIRTGVQKWRRKFEGEIFFSNFLIEEGKLVVNNEDQYVYCFDPISGSQLWKTKGSGTSSFMSYLEGVVYFNGGATGRLHAVDIRSGKTVWKLDTDRLDQKGDRFRNTAVYTIPGENGKKGKVIALSGLYAYCFEAYR
jgi:hypothetical protein